MWRRWSRKRRGCLRRGMVMVMWRSLCLRLGFWRRGGYWVWRHLRSASSFRSWCPTLSCIGCLSTLGTQLLLACIYHQNNAGNLSTIFDIGGVFGGIFAGLISDMLELVLSHQLRFCYSQFRRLFSTGLTEAYPCLQTFF